MAEKKEKVEEKKEKIGVISAVYKVNLHCPQCAHDIQKPLLRTPGVHSVDVKFEKGEITVKGAFEAKKIQGQLEKWSKKKVQLLSETKVKEAEKKEETKKETVKTTVIKVYMHCDQCERDLRNKLLQHKGIHNVKTDKKAQTITIEGIIEPEKLLTYMQKRVHKHAAIIPPKEKKEEKKDEKKEEKKDEKKDEKKEEKKDEKKDEKKGEKKEETKEKGTVEVKSKETTEVIEFQKEKTVEVKTDGHAPYFIHYVYAPQLFSDENPNACSIM